MNAVLLGVSFASNADVDRAISYCRSITSGIESLMDKDPKGTCRGDLRITEAYLVAAQNQLSHNKIDKALDSVKLAKKELGEISSMRTHCTEVSQDAKLLLSEVILLESELDILERMRMAFSG